MVVTVVIEIGVGELFPLYTQILILKFLQCSDYQVINFLKTNHRPLPYQLRNHQSFVPIGRSRKHKRYLYAYPFSYT